MRHTDSLKNKKKKKKAALKVVKAAHKTEPKIKLADRHESQGGPSPFIMQTDCHYPTYMNPGNGNALLMKFHPTAKKVHLVK